MKRKIVLALLVSSLASCSCEDFQTNFSQDSFRCFRYNPPKQYGEKSKLVERCRGFIGDKEMLLQKQLEYLTVDNKEYLFNKETITVGKELLLIDFILAKDQLLDCNKLKKPYFCFSASHDNFLDIYRDIEKEIDRNGTKEDTERFLNYKKVIENNLIYVTNEFGLYKTKHDFREAAKMVRGIYLFSYKKAMQKKK